MREKTLSSAFLKFPARFEHVQHVPTDASTQNKFPRETPKYLFSPQTPDVLLSGCRTPADGGSTAHTESITIQV